MNQGRILEGLHLRFDSFRLVKVVLADRQLLLPLQTLQLHAHGSHSINLILQVLGQVVILVLHSQSLVHFELGYLGKGFAVEKGLVGALPTRQTATTRMLHHSAPIHFRSHT